MLLPKRPTHRYLTLHLRQTQQWLNRPRDVDWHESCLFIGWSPALFWNLDPSRWNR